MSVAKKLKTAATPLDVYLETHARLLRFAADVIDKRLVSQPRIASGDVAFYVRRLMGIRFSLKEWRIRYIITTAYHMGAFDGHPFALRRGRGFVRASLAKKAKLRLVHSAKR